MCGLSALAVSPALASSTHRQILLRLRRPRGRLNVLSSRSWMQVWESFLISSSQSQLPERCLSRTKSLSRSQSQPNSFLLVSLSNHQSWDSESVDGAPEGRGSRLSRIDSVSKGILIGSASTYYQQQLVRHTSFDV